MPADARTDGARLAVAFADVLRAVGLDVPVSATVAFAEALAVVGVERRSGVYWAGRATMLRDVDERDRFDAAFRAFWLHAEPAESRSDAVPEPVVLLDEGDEADDAGDAGSSGEPDVGEAVVVRSSAEEVLRHKDFAACTDEELAEVHRLMARLLLTSSTRRSRRHTPSRGTRGRPDLRRTVRATVRNGGDPVPPRRRLPRERRRSLVLLLDVSGSMEPYARALLRFAHVAVAGGDRVEAFALGTRLTRLTRELATHDPDAALAAAAAAVPDWSGGTRLGEGLRRFCDRWGVRGLGRGAVVVVLSDGWERGDPALLGEQLARLRRVAHRIVWVNPLQATPGFQPIAGGMAAALPFVDRLVPGHSLASLEALAEVVAG